MQPQQPPKFVFGVGGCFGQPQCGGYEQPAAARFPPQATGLAILFTPRCHKSGRPANSAQKIVVDVPSTICLIETPEFLGRLLRIELRLSTPMRRMQPKLTQNEQKP